MSFELTNTSQFIETIGDTQWWRWTAFIQEQGDSSLDEIKYVEYQLHSSFKNPIKRVRKSKGGFPITMKGWGIFQLKARVVFENPEFEPLLLTHMLRFD